MRQIKNKSPYCFTVLLFYLLVFLMPLGSKATVLQENIGLTFEARVGYSIGATTPIGIPATIRELNSFSLTPNFLIGVDASLLMRGPWGVLTGLHLENKGMDAAAQNKVAARAVVSVIFMGDSPIA